MKASIVGSILGNILLVMGAAMLVGGLGRERQRFDATAANVQSLMLMLAAAALVMPAIFELVEGKGLPDPGAEIVNYDSDRRGPLARGRDRPHRDLCGGAHLLAEDPSRPLQPRRGARGGGAVRLEREALVGMLAIAGVAVGVMSEILVGSISEASEAIGLSEFFIGVIVVAIVGNAAEHWVAVLMAYKNKMNLAVNIAIGSSAQVALFVAPVLVIASFFMGPFPMPLVFNGFELGAVVLAILIANAVTHEGESTWFEGVQLLAVYAILAHRLLCA